jgi:glycosyltransferase involved in cell wall biosynthesis
VTPARAVELVVPAGIDDPLRPSGGNTYDRRLREELVAAGWVVRTRGVAVGLADTLATVPDGAVVIVDGLVASTRPEVVGPATARLRIVVLMHLPLGVLGDDVDRGREAAVVRASAAVVTTSEWTRRWLLDAYGPDPERVHVARPGVDAAPLAPGSADGTNLLCVGAVTAGKGHDALVAALAGVADRAWRCVCVGSLTRSPEFVGRVRRDLSASGLAGRVLLAGPRTGAELDAAYAAADALVLASRAETYGMVVTEALARGLPVLAWDVGGVPEALGETADGSRPGLLVPDGDVDALSEAVRRWLGDAGLRRRLRDAAARRRTGLTGWRDTADRVARVLESVQLVTA